MCRPLPTRSLSTHLALLLSLGLASGGCRPTPPPGKSADSPAASSSGPMNRETSQKLIAQRNLSLGLLENHQFESAARIFEEVRTAFPAEPFAVQNLAICLVKQAAEAIDERKDARGYAQAHAAALKAVEQLEKLAPESGLPAFLRAVLAAKSGEPAEIAGFLQTATERDPRNAAWLFQWFELGRSLRQPDEKAAAFRAGEKAAALVPDNLFVQKEVLAESLSQLNDLAKRSPDEAAARADELAAQLEKLRDPLRVLGVSLQVQAKIDLLTVLDSVLAALRDKQWPKARGEFFKIKNLLAQETASDADLIHSHPLPYHDPLNYVVLDFSPDFYQRADLPDGTLPQIEVAWKQADTVLPAVGEGVVQLDWLDFDLDGTDELVVLKPDRLSVHRRLSDGRGWQELAACPADGAIGFLAADLDDDVVDLAAANPGELGPATSDHCHEADLDFILFGPMGMKLVKNVFDPASRIRRLETIPLNESGLGDTTPVSDAQVVDFDHDGDLDLVTIAAGKLGLWLNLGNFTFKNVTNQSLLPPDDFQATAVGIVDWDQDNDIDILLSGAESSGWMENLRHGRMRFHEIDNGWSSARQIQVAELNGDGNWDLVITGSGNVRGKDAHVSILLTDKTPGALPKVKQTNVLVLDDARNVELVDFDNDGGMDLLITTGKASSLWRNRGHGEFKEVHQFPLPEEQQFPLHSPQLFGDVDADGDLDLIIAGDGKLNLFTNEGGNQNNRLEVRIRAQQVKANEQGASRRVNHYGVGSTVEVKSGARYQAQIADGPTTRFGLGKAEQADILRVLLTNGVPQNRIEPKANELVCERQVLQTSCPYLFTWNGSRYEFVTDLIWASPLGLNATQTELMPWRAWEYLKIDGAKLQPQDGEYRLQITEELWEAAYFDQVQLIAVDHPAEVEIYTNEKVGSAELAAHKIHTVRKPLLPKSVFDQSGRDWLSQLARRDEVYTRNYAHKFSQGLCAEHYLEFDLGELTNPGRITLFLAGWIRPTDTNINVALDQNPNLPSPTGLALWTPDAAGAWREVSPHVGFPNGKTKTIALDVSQAFSAGDYRLRLVTNREFYWDQAFFTVDEEPAEIRETVLPLVKADLHDRGVSRGILPAGDGPETYDYDQLAACPPWPAMGGLFTRYGDVFPLLSDEDDKLVVLGAGDEISLAFRVPQESVPEGWVRDFVLHNMGWVKDCHLNTWEGERVEPLPFVGMHDHDYWTGRPEETGEYAAYLRKYQTRRQKTTFRPFVLRWTPETKPTIPPWERDRRTGD